MSLIFMAHASWHCICHLVIVSYLLFLIFSRHLEEIFSFYLISVFPNHLGVNPGAFSLIITKVYFDSVNIRYVQSLFYLKEVVFFPIHLAFDQSETKLPQIGCVWLKLGIKSSFVIVDHSYWVTCIHICTAQLFVVLHLSQFIFRIISQLQGLLQVR